MVACAPDSWRTPMSDCVKRELLLPASIQDIWDVVTDDGWLADEVDLDLRPGGEVRFRLGGEVRTGWIEEALVPDEAARRASLIFWWAVDGEPASRVELTLEPWNELTRLR